MAHLLGVLTAFFLGRETHDFLGSAFWGFAVWGFFALLFTAYEDNKKGSTK